MKYTDAVTEQQEEFRDRLWEKAMNMGMTLDAYLESITPAPQPPRPESGPRTTGIDWSNT